MSRELSRKPQVWEVISEVGMLEYFRTISAPILNHFNCHPPQNPTHLQFLVSRSSSLRKHIDYKIENIQN